MTERVVDQVELESAFADGIEARLMADHEWKCPDQLAPTLLRRAWENGWNFGDRPTPTQGA